VKLLVTGGAGYIGSHTTVELLHAGHQIVVVDNLSNSKEEALKRVQELSGKSLVFYKVDLRDRDGLQAVFKSHPFDAVIHFAGLKSPGESVSFPLRYYHNNVTGTIILCETMAEFGVKSLVFSSSATVYGDSGFQPIREYFPCQPINPYGRTKWVIEIMLQDLHASDPAWNIALLRYFNPVGAHPSGRIGEDPQGIPANLLPFIAQVAVGRLPELRVFGGDYPTPDGTCIRDYIHVVDLAQGHLKALEKLSTNPGLVIYNLGTNKGHSVLEVISAFEMTIGRKIPYHVAGRRPGDAAVSLADASRANQELSWSSIRDIHQICSDMWRWQSNNPFGYGA
jgi:UDP-glucose 4-epimerase